MKPFLLGLLFIGSLCACDGKKVGNSTEEISKDSDTIVSESDSIAETLEDANPPKSADELFDDFLYSFTASRKYQKKRILFPLKVTTNGAVSKIENKAWHFDRLYQSRDTYTVLFSQEKDMRLEKDTSLKSVTVEWIYLKEKRVKQYFFNKISGQWFLTEIVKTGLSSHNNGNFFHFYEKFATDSLLQRHHLSEPLTFVTYDEETAQTIEGYVDKDQWFVFRPELPRDIITNVNYGQSFRNKNKRVLVIKGVANSMQSILTFKEEGGEWRLIRFEN